MKTTMAPTINSRAPLTAKQKLNAHFKERTYKMSCVRFPDAITIQNGVLEALKPLQSSSDEQKARIAALVAKHFEGQVMDQASAWNKVRDIVVGIQEKNYIASQMVALVVQALGSSSMSEEPAKWPAPLLTPDHRPTLPD
jgi:hypothetical protein